MYLGGISRNSLRRASATMPTCCLSQYHVGGLPSRLTLHLRTSVLSNSIRADDGLQPNISAASAVLIPHAGGVSSTTSSSTARSISAGYLSPCMSNSLTPRAPINRRGMIFLLTIYALYLFQYRPFTPKFSFSPALRNVYACGVRIYAYTWQKGKQKVLSAHTEQRIKRTRSRGSNARNRAGKRMAPWCKTQSSKQLCRKKIKLLHTRSLAPVCRTGVEGGRACVELPGTGRIPHAILPHFSGAV